MSEEKIPVTRGSGNVFADLDLPDADLRLAKARLVAALEEVAEKENLNQSEISRRCGATQPRVSRMLSGKGRGFTLDKIVTTLNMLGCDVSIKVSKAKPRTTGRLRIKTS